MKCGIFKVHFIQAMKWRDRKAGLKVFLGGGNGEREVIQEMPVLSLSENLL